MICDLAETYHIYNYRALPVDLLATLVTGLRADSRLSMKLTGSKVSNDTLLLAEIVDLLGLIWWSKTRDGQKGRNKPKSVFSYFQEENKNDTVSFNSPEEFNMARERILRGE